MSDNPKRLITEQQALDLVRGFVAERASSGVLLANGFTEITLSEGVLTAAWDENAMGKEKSRIVLGLSPFENLAEFIGTPFAFRNEQGKQIRQHIRQVSVIGPFGVGTRSVAEIYKIGTGLDLTAADDES